MRAADFAANTPQSTARLLLQTFQHRAIAFTGRCGFDCNLIEPCCGRLAVPTVNG
jgi:hypothetical protein